MRKIGQGVLAALALLLILVLVIVAFRLPLGESLGYIADGALKTDAGRARTLVRAAPLLLAGLGMIIAWRSGMYNIGGEGQLIVGLLLGATFAQLGASLPPGVLGYGILIFTALGGAAYAWLAGWLQVRRGVQVVISTILLNFIAIQALAYAVRGPLQESKRQLPQSEAIPNDAMMAKLVTGTDLHSGIFWALVAAFALHFWLSRHVRGFETRVVGANPRVARAQNIAVERTQLRAMALSGALCGLAGGIDYVGIAGQVADSSAQGLGFLAIPVALLGGLNPIGAIFSSLYFGALFAGTETMARFVAGANSLIYVIQAVAVLGFLALGYWNRRQEEARREP